jgi:hypothetical protein
VYSKENSPINGPGTWIGVNLEPVNEPQIANIAITEIMEAALLGVTALSSPNVTVLRLVKSSRGFVIELTALTI